MNSNEFCFVWYDCFCQEFSGNDMLITRSFYCLVTFKRREKISTNFTCFVKTRFLKDCLIKLILFKLSVISYLFNNDNFFLLNVVVHF